MNSLRDILCQILLYVYYIIYFMSKCVNFVNSYFKKYSLKKRSFIV